MRLTSEEIKILTEYLIKVLKRKRFSVKTNKYGNILYVEKFGIRCCPAILNSLEDGKHGFSYIQNIVNSYSEKDLGSYYKPRTNKSTHSMFSTNNSIDKYAGNENHIDMHNYKRVIEEFVDNLNKDYKRIVNRKATEELDIVGDEGKVIWSALRGAYVISPENYKVKGDICEILRKALTREDNIGPNLPYRVTNKQVDDIEELWRDDKWSVSIKKFFDENQLRIHNDSSRDVSIYVSDKQAVSDVVNYLDNWIKEHQDRIWKKESIAESLVKIKDTGTVFDGLTGEVESEDDKQVVVWLDLNGHRIRNNFKKENVDILEETIMEEEKKILKEDELDDEEDVGDGLEIIEFDDEAALALTNYLESKGGDAIIERAYPEDEYGYNSHVYRNLDDNSEWLVVDEEDADRYAREDIESLADDIGAIEAFGFDMVSYYLDDDYFDDMLREDVEYQVNEMDYEELESELLSYGIIDEDDMVPVDDDYDEDEESDEEPEMHFDEDFLDSKRDELIERYISNYDGGAAWFEEVFGEQEMSEYIKNNPECIDMDRLIDNILDNGSRGEWLSHYDGSEHELEYEDEHGSTHWLYAYRIN